MTKAENGATVRDDFRTIRETVGWRGQEQYGAGDISGSSFPGECLIVRQSDHPRSIAVWKREAVEMDAPFSCESAIEL